MIKTIREFVASHVIGAVARVIGGKRYYDELREVLIEGMIAKSKPKGPAPTINPDWLP